MDLIAKAQAFAQTAHKGQEEAGGAYKDIGTVDIVIRSNHWLS